MSTSAIAIPKRKQAIRPSSGVVIGSSSSSYQSSSSSMSTPSYSSLTGSPSLASNLSKAPVSAGGRDRIQPRRPSLLGSSLSKSEYTVVNLGHEDGPPRLVTCVKSSQGFDWNQELFLPSYATVHDSSDLEHRPDPVHEITLTDEEAAQVFPQ